MGKTPVFLDKVTSGFHNLRVNNSETPIEVKPEATLKISLFKGKFINVPVAEKKPVKSQAGEQKSEAEGGAVRQHPKEEPKKDLSPWEKFTNKSLNHF